MGALLDLAVTQNAQFQAAAAEVDDAARRRFRTQSGEDRFPAEAGLFRGIDYLERNSGLLFNSANEGVAIARFPGGAGGHGTVLCYAELIHGFFEITESLDGLFEEFFAEAVANENTFAEAQGVALIVEWFNVEGRVGASNRQAHGVRAGVDGSDVDRL